MTDAAFIVVYAIIATVVGMAYFAHRRWDAFFETHAIRGEAREMLLHHLMLGAAAVGAAWPVGIVFLLYCVAISRFQPRAERSAGRAPVL